MTGRNSVVELGLNDAIVFMALVRYADHRFDHGELLTVKGSQKFEAIARTVGLTCERPPHEFGFLVSRSVLRRPLDTVLSQAQGLVARHKAVPKVQELIKLCGNRSVAELEALEVDGTAQEEQG